MARSGGRASGHAEPRGCALVRAQGLGLGALNPGRGTRRQGRGGAGHRQGIPHEGTVGGQEQVSDTGGSNQCPLLCDLEQVI